MIKIKIKGLNGTYKTNSIYIFKFKDLNILCSYVKNDDGIYIFEMADLSYDMLLDVKVKPNESVVDIMKNGHSNPVLKETTNFNNFIF